MKLSLGETHPFEKFLEELQQLGYTKAAVAADKGEYAVRGGIVDLFPVSSPDPFRIEFWDDEIESIRIYDPVSQKSIRKVEFVEIPQGMSWSLVNMRSTSRRSLNIWDPDLSGF